ncbi:hypothetical protein A2U01_0118083, partial [Trifolium medium]|nr:hypothetical protein [Trifolium medium]
MESKGVLKGRRLSPSLGDKASSARQP